MADDPDDDSDTEWMDAIDEEIFTGAGANEKASSEACAVCGKDIPDGMGLECDECENLFCDGSCARQYGCDGGIHH
jgi:hypothetical protein